jgi:hypothetical protein
MDLYNGKPSKPTQALYIPKISLLNLAPQRQLRTLMRRMQTARQQRSSKLLLQYCLGHGQAIKDPQHLQPRSTPRPPFLSIKLIRTPRLPHILVLRTPPLEPHVRPHCPQHPIPTPHPLVVPLLLGRPGHLSRSCAVRVRFLPPKLKRVRHIYEQDLGPRYYVRL